MEFGGIRSRCPETRCLLHFVLQTSLLRGSRGADTLETSFPHTLLDDWGLYPLEPQSGRDLFDVLEDRSHRGAIIVVSQIPIAHWYELFPAPTLADAILDRLVHNAYRIEMKGDSMRKKQSPKPLTPKKG